MNIPDPVSNSVVGVASEIRKGLDDLITTDAERAEADIRLQSILQKPHLLQALANIESAKNGSMFVAGARPAALWVCVLGFGWEFVIRPLLASILTMGSLWGFEPVLMVQTAADLPSLDSDALMTLMFALLGLAGWRTTEKLTGTARNRLK